MSDTPTVLLTRPAAQSDRFAGELRAVLGDVPAVVSPVLAIRLRDRPGVLDTAAGLILTSENAVTALAGWDRPANLTGYCVGRRTAEAAAAAGLDAVSADGDAEALLALIRRDRPVGPLLHLRGTESRGDIAGRLTRAGIETVEAIVYDQVPQDLTDAARTLLDGRAPVILPLFSPRSARLAGDRMAGARAPLALAALSPAVAAAWTGPGPARQIVCQRPDSPAMIDAIAALYREMRP